MGIWSTLLGKSEEKQLASVQNAFSWLGIDMHNHVLPGIDDGANTVEDSLTLIRFLQDAGYKKMVCTPHIMRGGYDNTPQTIKAAHQELNEYLEKQGVSFPISVAAEYYFDEYFSTCIKEDMLLHFGEQKFVLFEMSYLIEPLNVSDVLFDLQSAGYTPLLAHPERYPFYSVDPLEKYGSLREQGVYFQLNLFSLAGAYGNGAKKAAEWLIENNMVDFVGSDLHNSSQFPNFSKAIKHPLFNKMKTLAVADNQPELL